VQVALSLVSSLYSRERGRERELRSSLFRPDISHTSLAREMYLIFPCSSADVYTTSTGPTKYTTTTVLMLKQMLRLSSLRLLFPAIIPGMGHLDILKSFGSCGGVLLKSSKISKDIDDIIT
jgi:hypothetical protein